MTLVRLSVSNSLSSRHWELHETPAVGRPTHLVKFGAGHHTSAREAQRGLTFQRRVTPCFIVVSLKLRQLPFQIAPVGLEFAIPV